MNEKNMQSLWTSYIRENPPEKTTVYELKIVKGTSMPFDRVAPHQVANLIGCRTSEGHYHKIPDMSAKNGFSGQKPWDCQFIVRSKAYLVLWFYKERQKKIFYLVDIFEFQRIKGVLQRKSVTEDIIKTIAEEAIQV